MCVRSRLADPCGSKVPCIRWGLRSPTVRGICGDISAHCYVPTHECIALCSPAAVGECTNAFIDARADKRTMRPLAKVLWTSVNPYYRTNSSGYQDITLRAMNPNISRLSTRQSRQMPSTRRIKGPRRTKIDRD